MKYKQVCPGCGRPQMYMQRYPRYICESCTQRMTDRNGVPIPLSLLHNGYAYLDGKLCTVSDAYMGGTVIEME